MDFCVACNGNFDALDCFGKPRYGQSGVTVTGICQPHLLWTIVLSDGIQTAQTWCSQHGYISGFVDRNKLLVQRFQYFLGRKCVGKPWHCMAHLLRCKRDDYHVCAHRSPFGRESKGCYGFFYPTVDEASAQDGTHCARRKDRRSAHFDHRMW